MFGGVCKGGSGGFPACPCTVFLPQLLLLHLRYNISIFHDPPPTLPLVKIPGLSLL